MTKRLLLLAVVGVILSATAGGGEAFVRWVPSSGGPPLHQNPKTAEMVLHTQNSDLLANVQEAADAWTNAGSQFFFTVRVGDNVGRPPCSNDGINAIVTSFPRCSRVWTSRILATTRVWYESSGRVTDTDVLFNPNLTWDAYDGPRRRDEDGQPIYDFRRILLHELGHVLGLDHPDEQGQTQPAIMRSRTDDLYTLQPDDIAGIQFIYGVRHPHNAALENPQANAFESGIGLISGWVCDATTVEVQVDSYPRIRMAYGTSRNDTQAVCGDTDNGFGALINWNLFGSGEHTIRLYVDGVRVRSRQFTVRTFGRLVQNAEFVRGLQGMIRVPDFPVANWETVLRWEESSQNFVIDDIR